jgi:hypothetical protein
VSLARQLVGKAFNLAQGGPQAAAQRERALSLRRPVGASPRPTTATVAASPAARCGAPAQALPPIRRGSASWCLNRRFRRQGPAPHCQVAAVFFGACRLCHQGRRRCVFFCSSFGSGALRRTGPWYAAISVASSARSSSLLFGCFAMSRGAVVRLLQHGCAAWVKTALTARGARQGEPA